MNADLVQIERKQLKVSRGLGLGGRAQTPLTEPNAVIENGNVYSNDSDISAVMKDKWERANKA